MARSARPWRRIAACLMSGAIIGSIVQVLRHTKEKNAASPSGNRSAVELSLPRDALARSTPVAKGPVSTFVGPTLARTPATPSPLQTSGAERTPDLGRRADAPRTLRDGRDRGAPRG